MLTEIGYYDILVVITKIYSAKEALQLYLLKATSINLLSSDFCQICCGWAFAQNVAKPKLLEVLGKSSDAANLVKR